MSESASRTATTSPVDPPLQEGMAGEARLEALVRWVFGHEAPEEYHFRAGEVLIEEGDEVARRPALLIVEGEVEEYIGAYSPEDGLGEHSVHVARVGDLANVQAITEPYFREPSQCSLRATEDGYCFLVWKSQVDQRADLRAILEVFHARWTESVGRQRSQAIEHEDLLAHVSELQQTQGAEADRGARAVMDEWAGAKFEALSRKAEELQDELDRVQLALWEAKEKNDETAAALDLERRARAALEQRTLELLQHIADRSEADNAVADRFPTAVRILESAELEAMEAEAKRHREMAVSFETRARMLHRAFERLAADNPGLRIKPDVMQLMLGEEPARLADLAPQPPLAPEPDNDTKRDTLPFWNRDQSAPAVQTKIPPSAPIPSLDEPIPHNPDDRWASGDHTEPPSKPKR